MEMSSENNRHIGKSLRSALGVLLVAFFILHSSFFFSGCTQIDCPAQNRVYTVYQLKKANGTTDTLRRDTLWVWSTRIDGTDTMISRKVNGTLELNYFNGSTATTFDLPISYTQPEDVLYMLLKNSKNTYLDTVRIKKENIAHFESVDCQAAYFHMITAVACTHNVIDSIVINNPYVNYDASNAHFKLYLKAQR